MKRVRTGLYIAAGLLLAPWVSAQGTEAEGDPMEKVKELARQVRRNMVAVETEIDRVESKDATARSNAAREDVEKMIQSLRGRGDQIATDIEEIIKSIPP